MFLALVSLVLNLALWTGQWPQILAAGIALALALAVSSGAHRVLWSVIQD